MRVLKNGTVDPFSLVRERRVRARAEFLKAGWAPRYRLRTKSPEYDNPIPVAVRRMALRADHLVRAQSQQRKHRSTGRPRGPRRDDQAIAREVRWYESDYLMSRIDAMKLLAGALASAERIEVKSAMARVRRALRKF